MTIENLRTRLELDGIRYRDEVAGLDEEDFAERTLDKMRGREPKQVIAIRRDLGMTRGKECAQVAHASMAFLVQRVTSGGTYTAAELAWLNGSFTKIVVQVRSEADLRAVHHRAHAASLESHLITDLGRTMFRGRRTLTAVAVGPDWPGQIDPVTGTLELY